MTTYMLEVTADEVQYLRTALEYLEDSLAPWDYDDGDEEKLIDMIRKLRRFEQATVIPH